MDDAPAAPPAPARRRPARRTVLALALLALAVAFPALSAGSPFLLTLAVHALIAALVAVSLDLMTGQAGMISFGHAGWYGLGAYAAGLFARAVSADLLACVGAAMLAAALLALATGPILTRQAGKSFAILTLALSQIVYSLVFIASGVTGGEDGLQGVPRATLLGLPLSGTLAWYAVALAFLAGACALVLFLSGTAAGRVWHAIKENEERARFIGVGVAGHKLFLYTASASLAAAAGALFVLFTGTVSPDVLHWVESGRILMYVILGGVGTVVGPALGAVAFTLAEHHISTWTDSWLIWFGALFVVVVIAAPGGVLGLFGIKGREG